MARYSKSSSTELVRACAGSKDEEAWQEFIRRFQVVIAAAVLRTARHWGEPSRPQLDDLIQDTYLKLCENDSRLLRSFQPRHQDSIYGFLKVVAANVVHDHFKSALAAKRGVGQTDAILGPVQMDPKPARADSFAEAARWLGGSPARAAVLANAAPRYYDVWALRHDRWCPQDCWHPIWGRPEEESFEAAKFREVFARQIEIPAALPPIAVRSAFGGLGIYRLSAALAARYCGLDGAGREVSEHVAFNEAIARSGGELCIFPSLQVRAPEQHLYRACEFSRRWRLAMLARRTAEMLRPPWRRFFPP